MSACKLFRVAKLPMQTRIYIYQDNNRQGPFSLEQLQDMYDSGKVNAQTLAWRQGMTDWSSLCSVLPSAPPPVVAAGQQAVVTYAAAQPPALQNPLCGVGGWLLFYCICLTILAPLLTLSNSLNAWNAAQAGFELLPLLKTISIIENVQNAFIVLYGMWVGIALWRAKPKAVAMVRTYLLVRLCLFVLLALVIISMSGSFPEHVSSSLKVLSVGTILRELVHFLVWWFYFKKSRRVQLTFEQR